VSRSAATTPRWNCALAAPPPSPRALEAWRPRAADRGIASCSRSPWLDTARRAPSLQQRTRHHARFAVQERRPAPPRLHRRCAARRRTLPRGRRPPNSPMRLPPFPPPHPPPTAAVAAPSPAVPRRTCRNRSMIGVAFPPSSQFLPVSRSPALPYPIHSAQDIDVPSYDEVKGWQELCLACL
jgi:hypothetical protein